MKSAKTKNKILSAVMAFALAITLLAGFPAAKVYAASGTVYTCTINRCYAHPYTGEIEDSGGESSYATGQGMVEGCVYSSGILELTDDGAYYLTIRMSLMDYTSGHSFQVQNVGDSGWSTPSELGITGNGSDSNGTTSDICMRVPSENCIVRGSMYVEPMGRDVIFYLYPSNYSEGNSTDMNATIVTESSGVSSGTDAQTYTEQTEATDSGQSDSSTGSAGASNLTSGNASLKSTNSSSTSDSSTDDTKEAKKLQSSITEAAQPKSSAESSSTDSSTIDQAEGLSLSTASDSVSADSSETAGNESSSPVTLGFVIVIAGVILIAVAAAVVYFFRKNWKRWGGADDDDE